MSARKYLGVDLGATNTKMVVVSIPESGEPSIDSVDSMPTRGDEGHEAENPPDVRSSSSE